LRGSVGRSDEQRGLGRQCVGLTRGSAGGDTVGWDGLVLEGDGWLNSENMDAQLEE
jgi:hypothetical protein